MFIKFSPFLIALLIGLLVGVDREKQGMRNRQAMGVRSYILFALVGSVSGAIMQPMFTVGMLVFATAITLYGYMKTSSLRRSDEDPIGLTSEIAAMAVFALGYYAHLEPFFALALGMILFFILHNKSLFHSFVKSHLRPNEIKSASVLLLLAIGVVPLIPDRVIDPFNIFNPHRLATIIVVLAAVQFGGYVAIRIFGNKIGLPLAGFFAGLASSTAVFLSYPKLAAANSHAASVVAAALFSITGTMCLLAMVVGVISWPLVVGISIPVVSIIVVTSAVALLLSLRSKTQAESSTQVNPLNLWHSIQLGLFLTGLIFVVDLTERHLGGTFTTIVTFLGGLFELHGVVIASANMLENDGVKLQTAVSTALVAITASMVSKIAITAFFSQGRYRVIMLPIILGLCLLSAAFWALVKFVPAIVITI